jgi:adenylosuccinate synthase
MGLPPIKNLFVYGTLRTFPIRVGNTPDGYSGDGYPDQREIAWEELGVAPELTTVTRRIRRVFTFSFNQLEEALWHCRPDFLFVNFCNYIRSEESLESMLKEIDAWSQRFGGVVFLTGHGPSYYDVKIYNS